MSNFTVLSLNAGELSPLVDARSDVAKYSSGARTIQNMIPRVYGCAVRRPGSEYIYTARSGATANPVLLVPFEYSATDAYICEFGHTSGASSGYIRFFKDGGILLGAADTSCVGTVTSSGKTVTFSSAADAVKAGYHLTDPKLGAQITADGQVARCTTAWTNSTTCTVDRAPSPAWSTTAITNVKLPVQVATPYAQADLFSLQFKQLNDVMWITHQSYSTMTLSRTSATSFSLAYLQDYIAFVMTNEFTGGPFRERNDLAVGDDITIYPSGTTGAVTLTASSAMFVDTQQGALFKLVQPRVNVTTSGSKTTPTTGVICAALSVKGPAIFHTDGTWTGVVKLQRCVDGTNWEDYRVYTNRNIDSEAFDEESDGVQYRANVTVLSVGTINADLTVNNSEQEGICMIVSSAGTVDVPSTTAVALVISDFASSGAGSATVRWAEGAWSDYRGWPRTMTFFGERAVYAGNTESPDTIWLSKVGDYYDFTEGTDDDDAFTVQLASDKRHEIQWIAALDSILIGTTGGEWRMFSSGNDDPLTPTNWAARQQAPYGVAAMQATPVGDALLYVDRPTRKLREMAWNDTKSKYVSSDLTALAEHITEGGIVDYAFQKNPEPIVWMVLGASPWLISLTYNREQDVIAAAKHPLGGSGIAESVCVIPGDEEDEVWLAVRRTINSVSVRYIERLKPWNFGAQEDAFFVDCGLKYDSTAATSFTGADHLEGETVSILADGVVETPAVVASGAYTIGTAASVVIGGLPYTYTVKPMRLDANLLSRGLTKRISQIILNFYETLGAQYGRDDDHLYDVFTKILENKYGLSDAAIFDSLRDVLIDRYGAVAGAAQFDIDWPRTSVFEAVPLFTGDVPLAFDGEFDSDDDLIVTGSDPLPCTLISITVIFDALGPQ